MADNIQADIREISYGSLVFRHIDRILALSSKDFQSDDEKLFTFRWAVKLLRSSIPKDIIDKEFTDKEKALNWDGKTYKEKFEQTQELFSLCIDHLAEKGYLYRKVVDGEYDAEP